MNRCLAPAAAFALAGSNCYADFTPSPLHGGDPQLSFAFDENPEPVLSDGVDTLNPSVAPFAGLTNLYSVSDGRTWSTALATSNVVIKWQLQRLAVSPGSRQSEDDYIAANRSSVEHRGTLWYWYQAGSRNAESVGLARMDSPPPIPPQRRLGLARSTVLIDNGTIHVWFGGGDGASPDENLHGKIGFATPRPASTPIPATEAK